MARTPGDHHAAFLGPKTMTRTIHCPACQVVLNVPEEASGRKLKCPKCATKFAAPTFGPADSALAGPGPASTLFPTRKGPPSSGDFDRLPGAGSSGSIELPALGPKKGGSTADFDLPLSTMPSGDTYELPFLVDLPSPSSGPHKGPAGAAPTDALALFKDEPKSNRKVSGAEARAKARRCPSCGGVVGAGMSLCNTCGLDLETGQRITPLDVFEDEMPTITRSEVPPMGVIFVGSVSAMLNLLLAFASLIGYAKGQGPGMLCLMVIWGFGIYASVQFLRRKSTRPLALALGLGVMIGSIYLIALPIWDVNVGGAILPDAIPDLGGEPIDPDAPRLVNIADQLDMRRITWGIALLLAYAAVAVYLNSPGVKRQFSKK